MSHNYLDKFNINKIYRNNSAQTVLIGSSKEQAEQHVIINILHGDKFLPRRLKEQFALLYNLVHLEDMGDGVVVVTTVDEGPSLDEYMKQNVLSIGERIELAYSYLKKITRYDGFSNDMKDILVGENQIIVKEDKILLHEAIITDNPLAQREYKFDKVAQSVGTVLAKIFYTKTSYNQNVTAFSGVIEFINNLKYSTHQYKNFSDIFNEFAKISNELLTNSANLLSQDTHIQEQLGQSKKSSPKKIIGIVSGLGLSLILVTGLWANMGHILKNAYNNKAETTNAVEDEQIHQTFASNNISLLDHTYNEEDEIDIDTEDALETFAINYLTPEFVATDKNVFRSQPGSLKFTHTEEETLKSIWLNNIEATKDEYQAMSLWLMSDSLEPVTIDFEGYNNNILQWHHPIHHQPYATGVWEMINFDLPLKDISKIKISLVSATSTIWIDDMNIEIYK